MKASSVRLIGSGMVVAALLAGGVVGADHAQAGQPTPNPKSKTCVPANNDGNGGPYPATKSANCKTLKSVTVWVVADPTIGGGFEPSNITIKKGTKVTWIWQAGGHNLAPFDPTIESQGHKFSKTFTKAGTYKYMCQVHPGQNGVVIVK
jgi:plastocyanin